MLICTPPAYDRLASAGIIAQIKKHQDEVEELVLASGIPDAASAQAVLTWARTFLANRFLDGEQARCAREIVQRAEESTLQRRRGDGRNESLPRQTDWFLAHLLIGQDLFSPEKFGFPNATTLATAITTYCNEFCSWSELGDAYSTWRSTDSTTGRTNAVFLSLHGDVHYIQSQYRFCAPTIEETLFGQEILFAPVTAEECNHSIVTYQDSSPMLLALLYYAQHLRLDTIDEIVNWREVLRETGEHVVHAAEALGNHNEDFFTLSVNQARLAGMHEFGVGALPLIIFQGPGAPTAVPVIKDQKLLICLDRSPGTSTSSSAISFGDGSTAPIQAFNRQVFPYVTYTAADLPELLRATMKYFARDRSRLYRIMDLFNTGQLKSFPRLSAHSAGQSSCE